MINLISLTGILIISELQPITILFTSFIISLILCFSFNTKPSRFIKKEAARINAELHLIKIYYSLVEKSLHADSDKTIAFIKTIKKFNNSIAWYFQHIFKHIQEGQNPERFLNNIITFSEDFDFYLKDMLLNEFEKEIVTEAGTLERDFRVYLRQIESRLSIMFFIGAFFPIGISFLFLFQILSIYYLMLLLPFYFYILRIFFKKFIKKDIFLLGLMKDYSKTEKKRFDEFILFLRRFAINLKKEISPEQAFIDTFNQLKYQMKYLYETMKRQSHYLTNLLISFSEMVNYMKLQINSRRYSIILGVLNRILAKNSLEASFKIQQIIELLNQHQKLEEKLKIIIKGEKFKTLMFIFILPFILGVIGGIFPSFFLFLDDIDIQGNIFHYIILNNTMLMDISLVFLFYLFCLVISTYFFLKIVNFEQNYVLIIISMVTYIFIFIISFINISKLL